MSSLSVLSAPVQLSEHLYIVYSEFPHVDCANVYLITGKTPTLIDCGSPRGHCQLVNNLGQLGVSVSDIEQIVVTHGDYDHIQGFHDLQAINPEIQLFLHPKDWPALSGLDSYQDASYLYGLPFRPIDIEQCLAAEAGDVIAAGDSVLSVLHTPGHTEGSICLLGEIDGQSVLFAGDAIGGAMKSLTGADLDLWFDAVTTWKHSLQQVSDASFEWVLNGHEPAQSLPIQRHAVDRLIQSFGKMLNPWFTLHEEKPEASVGSDDRDRVMPLAL